jgi:hypothetical protein
MSGDGGRAVTADERRRARDILDVIADDGQAFRLVTLDERRRARDP